jgi:hypothetical protein
MILAGTLHSTAVCIAQRSSDVVDRALIGATYLPGHPAAVTASAAAVRD